MSMLTVVDLILKTEKVEGPLFGKVIGMQSIFCVCCQADVPRGRFPESFISDESCDNGLFTIQLVFVFGLFPRRRSQNTAKHSSLKNLEKNCVVPLLSVDVLSRLATEPNLNRSKVNLCLYCSSVCL